MSARLHVAAMAEAVQGFVVECIKVIAARQFLRYGLHDLVQGSKSFHQAPKDM